MGTGIGVTEPDIELNSLEKTECEVKNIHTSEFLSRIQKAQALMKKEAVNFCYINAGTNLYYFTGINWSPSERLLGCIIPSIMAD